MTATANLLFQGSDTKLVSFAPEACGQFSGTTLVTFPNMELYRTATRAGDWKNERGFGENAFSKIGFREIHILTCKNNWLQTPEMGRIIAIINEESIGSERVVLFGSSMGGFAALNYSASFRHTHVVALSPQFSIDPNKVSGDQRWLSEFLQLNFDYFYNDEPYTGGAPFIFYDPLDADANHAQQYEERRGIQCAAIPHGGHPVAEVINQTIGLRSLLIACLSGAETPESIANKIKQQCARSSSYLANKALSDLSSGDVALAKAALDRSLKATGLSLQATRSLIQVANKLHEWGMATQLAVRLMEQRPDNSSAARECALAYARTGEIATAAEYYQRALTLSNNSERMVAEATRFCDQYGIPYSTIMLSR